MKGGVNKSWDIEEKSIQKEGRSKRVQRLKEAVSEFRHIIAFFKQKSEATSGKACGLPQAEEVRLEKKYFKQLNLFE